MNELSLFTGAGGGVLGTKLLGWRTVGYVEWEKYCQKIIEQRIKDGFLDEAPIFGDIDHFIESGAAKKYAGFVDVVTAGFPCQPFSVAGKKRGQDDERNKWPQTLQCIRDVRPRYALLENVPGLLNSGYFGEILSSLAEAGFDARWVVLGADDVGAPHRRKRLWILADSDSKRYGRRDCEGRGDEGRNLQQKEREGREMGREVEGCGSPYREDVADSSREGLQGPQQRQNDEEETGRGKESATRTTTERCRDDWGDWWSTEPDVGRVAHGVASRVDRLKALGNGQVPAVAATAWVLLTK
jgi:DNA (cytosine-5)-methyltransferase 1